MAKKSRLCTLCARGGSKGVPGKNVRPILGKPLLAWSILQARTSGLFDAIAFSSDSDQILEAASRYGVTNLIRRPDELAHDFAGKVPAIQHAVRDAEAMLGMRFDTVVDLDVTSPLRAVSDIVASVSLLESTGAPNVVTAMPARRSPYFNLVELNQDSQVVLSKPSSPPILRRQDAPRCFDMNASIYVWNRPVLDQAELKVIIPGTKLWEMPEERSIDIDSELDFQWVSWLAEQTQVWKDLQE